MDQRYILWRHFCCYSFYEKLHINKRNVMLWKKLLSFLSLFTSCCFYDLSEKTTIQKLCVNQHTCVEIVEFYMCMYWGLCELCISVHIGVYWFRYITKIAVCQKGTEVWCQTRFVFIVIWWWEGCNGMVMIMMMNKQTDNKRLKKSVFAVVFVFIRSRFMFI